MTKEEAKKEFWKNGGVFERVFKSCLKDVIKCSYQGIEIDNYIDKIYDDLESRTCRNCKYLDAVNVCQNIDSYCYDNFIDEEDFGCNRFESL